LVAGKKNCSVANILALVGSLLRNWANTAAWMGFLVERMTAVVEPPQLPELGLAASHCGSGAARHLPEVAFAEPERKAGPQAPVSQVAYLPLFRAAYQALVKSGSTPITPSLASVPQYWPSFWETASSTLTVMSLLLEVTYGLAPACHNRPCHAATWLAARLVR
jgi:hypothetical protein